MSRLQITHHDLCQAVGEYLTKRKRRKWCLASVITTAATLMFLPQLISQPDLALAHEQNAQITYAVDEVDEPPIVRPKSLRATVDGQTYELISKDEGMCLEVLDQRDYDGNGARDALVKLIAGCGGNCCANTFFFYSYVGDGHFEKSDEFGYSWTEPVVERWNGRWSVRVASVNEGINTDPPREIMERYVLDSGNAVEVEHSERKSIIALIEMRSSDFDWSSFDEERTILYDLDGDGISDTITGRLWHRWGRILWSVHLSSEPDDKDHIHDDACKRIGVLAAKTKGVHDLVCDQDDIFKWDGTDYNSSRSLTPIRSAPTAVPPTPAVLHPNADAVAWSSIDEANHVWSSVIAPNGAPVVDLDRVYAGSWLTTVRDGVLAMQAKGQYRVARQTAPLVVHSARIMDDGRIEARAAETWDDRLYAADGTLVTIYPGRVEQRYVLQQIGAGWYVVESQVRRY